MFWNWRSEIPQLLIIVGMLITGACLWPVAPDSFPAHWNLQGEVDRYGGKFEGLFLLPLVTAGLYALMVFLPRIDPCRANYESFRSAYLVIRWALLILMATIYGCVQLTAFGYATDMGRIVPLAVGALLIVLGNVMGKIRTNWFVGVRTPWTLSSQYSWNKTHRLAGWLFVVMGVAFAACGVFRTAWMMLTAVVILVVAVIWLTIYSYLKWREDPQRSSPTQITPA